MTTFTVKQTIACYVTWTYKVDAETEYEAQKLTLDSLGETIGDPEIGDCLESWPERFEIIKHEGTL